MSVGDTHDMELLQLYLKRCPTAQTLTLRMNEKDCSSPEVIRRLEEYASHLNILDLHGKPSELAQSLQFTAPHLRCLVLREDFGTGESSIHVPQEAGILNNLSTQNLKAFCSVGSSTFLPANHFPNLTHLLLDVLQYRTYGLLDGVFGLLRRTPLVQCLTLWDINIDDMSPLPLVADANATVQLGSLRWLTITTLNFSPYLPVILSRISFDRNRVYTRILGPTRMVELPLSVFHSVAEQCMPPTKEIDTYLDLVVSRYQFVFVLKGPTSGFCFRAAFRGSVSEWPRGSSFTYKLSQFMSLESVLALRVVVEDLEGTMYPYGLYSFTRLSWLQIVVGPDYESTLAQSIASLCEKLEEPQWGPFQPQSAVGCPHLKYLSISADFSMGDTTEACADALARMLLTRKTLGKSIDSLAIQCLLKSGDEVFYPDGYGRWPDTKPPEQSALYFKEKLLDSVDKYIPVPQTDWELCDFGSWDAWADISIDEEYWYWHCEHDRPDDLASYLDENYYWDEVEVQEMGTGVTEQQT